MLHALELRLNDPIFDCGHQPCGETRLELEQIAPGEFMALTPHRYTLIDIDQS